jgi:hypothetical protein
MEYPAQNPAPLPVIGPIPAGPVPSPYGMIIPPIINNENHYQCVLKK